MGDLAVCLPVTLKYEGLWSNNAHDPGGATMKGVTQKVYDAWRRRHGLQLQSVRYISDAELLALYDEGYFKPIDGASLSNGVAVVSFDYAVNSGVGAAKKALKASAGLVSVPRIKAICNRRLSILHGLKNWRYFGKGWGSRVADVMVKGIRLESGASAKIDLQIAAHEHIQIAKAKTKAASTTLATAAATPVATQAAHTDIQIWAIVAAAAAIAALGALIFLSIRKHQDVSSALLTASQEG